jgi:hypothetical protein
MEVVMATFDAWKVYRYLFNYPYISTWSHFLIWGFHYLSHYLSTIPGSFCYILCPSACFQSPCPTLHQGISEPMSALDWSTVPVTLATVSAVGILTTRGFAPMYTRMSPSTAEPGPLSLGRVDSASHQPRGIISGRWRSMSSAVLVDIN